MGDRLDPQNWAPTREAPAESADHDRQRSERRTEVGCAHGHRLALVRLPHPKVRRSVEVALSLGRPTPQIVQRDHGASALYGQLSVADLRTELPMAV
jgi:hypothetical protein